MKNVFVGLILILFLSACRHIPVQKYSSQKLGTHDPFKTTMVPSEFFDIDASRDNVVEGANGTIIALPKGCFIDKNGDVVTGKVNVELAEAFQLNKMLGSNLTTTSDGQQLETDGMIYLNASADTDKIFINKDKPVYIEMPSNKKRNGMMVYQGVRDDNGNMNWINPKPTEVFLTPVDINSLDFLPEGFEAEVNKNMPFAGQRTATRVFTDSLYYSFSRSHISEITEVEKRLKETGSLSYQPFNEPHNNPNKKITNGAYTKESYSLSSNENKQYQLDSSSDEQSHLTEIDPARIKALKDPHFNNTLIATREFAKRLQFIFKTCNKNILEIYVKNLDKNMWELDEMAAAKLGNDPIADVFRKFAAEKLTNVKDATEQALLIKDYYEKRLTQMQAEITDCREKAEKLLEARHQLADSMADAYRKLLWKREQYRMEHYGFTWTDMGWINIDTGWIPKKDPAVRRKLEVKVENAEQYDRVNVYIIFEYMKSLYRLNAESNSLHYVGNESDRSMDMQLDKKAVIVAVAYKDTLAYLAVKDYITGSVPLISLEVAPTSQDAIDNAMRDIEKGNFNALKAQERPGEGAIAVSKKSDYTEENSIEVDLAYEAFFYQEETEAQRRMRDEDVLVHLESLVYPCRCNGGEFADGRSLFYSNCSSCHSLYSARTGPPLANATKSYDRKWLYSFTRNWNDLVAAGDKQAIELQNSYKSEMNLFPNLKDEDLKKLYDYIECQSGDFTTGAKQ